MEYLAREPLYIHHGGGSFERRSKVELPLLEGIFECYRKFGYTSVKQSLTLEEEYPARSYAAPGTTIASIRTIPAHKETRQKLVDTIVHDPLYIAGELVKPGYTEPVYTTETVDVPEKTYTSYEYLPGGQVYEEASYGPLNEGMIAVVEDLIKQVSEIRAGLGADQNRLERAYLINQNVLENTQSAESTIRDTDMAEEIMRFSRENILQQAGQSMLAQANSQQQQVLSLLQQ
ncbi:MAG: flagellin [Lachnospiraceae bacterium]|nr:flagellin [Lachnospiraceae bacterium]